VKLAKGNREKQVESIGAEIKEIKIIE